MLEAIAAGDLLVDFISLDVDVPLSAMPRFTGAAGGATANVAVGLQRQGIRAGFIGRVGDDPFGRHLRDTLAEAGVETSRVVFDAGARTTLAFIATRTDGRKDIAFYRHPGAEMLLRPEDIPADYLRGARLFHFGSITLSKSPAREAALHGARLARELGLLVSYDPNWRPTLWDDHEEAGRVLWEAMPLADIVHCAEEEWEFVTGTADLAAGAAKILAAGPKLVVVTCGAEGCWYGTASAQGRVPGFAVETVDTVGAGDAFVAALLAQVLRSGKSTDALSDAELREIMVYANAAGALTVTRPGVIPSLPTAAEVGAFLETRR